MVAASALALCTRECNQIENWYDPSEVTGFDIQIAQSLKVKHPVAIHRSTSVSYGYNCHGLTFASRRTQITDAQEVRKIIANDGYSQVVDRNSVSPGDIVLYISRDGDIEHSGLVVEVRKNELIPLVMVLSKWGAAHEVIHGLSDCPYDARQVEYYRMEK